MASDKTSKVHANVFGERGVGGRQREARDSFGWRGVHAQGNAKRRPLRRAHGRMRRVKRVQRARSQSSGASVELPWLRRHGGPSP
eukprot:1537599-Pleurochrysis_carterae.AAC.3